MRYQAMLIDADNTLFDFTKSEKHAIAELFEKYEDVALVLYYYNGDSTNLKRYKETGYLSYYVKSILEKSEALEYAHGKREVF